MTPQQALEIVEQMRLQFQCDGKSHDLIQRAVQIITAIVLKPEPQPEPDKDKSK